MNNLNLYYAPIVGAKGTLDTNPRELTVNELCNTIKDSPQRELIEEMRTLGTKKDRKSEIKLNRLDYLAPHFYHVKDKGCSSKSDITTLSGYVTYDFDNVGKSIGVLRANLARLKPVLLFTSPSGEGLKCFFYVEELYEKSLEVYNSDLSSLIKQRKQDLLFSKVWKIVANNIRDNVEMAGEFMDMSCKNYNRLCCMSHDAEAVYNEEQLAAIVDIEIPELNVNENEHVEERVEHLAVAMDILNNIKRAKGWLDFDDDAIFKSCSFFSNFGEIGRKASHQLHRLCGRYSNPDSKFFEEAGTLLIDKKFEWMLKNNEGLITLNLWRELVTSKLRGCNIAQISGITVVQRENELGNIAPGQYISTSKLGEFFDGFTKVNKVRYDVVRESLIVDGKDQTDRDFRSLVFQIRDEFKIYNPKEKVSLEEIKGYLLSACIPSYHPLYELYQEYKDSDTQDALYRCINSIQGVCTVAKSCIHLFFKKMVKQILYGNPNELMLLFVGPQNVGKTAFIKQLFGVNSESPIKSFKGIFKGFQKYFSGSGLDFKNKDGDIALSTNFGVLFDELVINNKTPIQDYKRLSSRDSIKVRRPYSSVESITPRRASIFFTANNTDLLTEDANRRFIPLHIKGIDWRILNSIDMGAVWADALKQVIADGKEVQYCLSSEQQKWVTAMTQTVKSLTPEDDVIELLEYFDEEDKREPITASELSGRIYESMKIKTSSMKLAHRLTEDGVKRIKSGKTYLYYVGLKQEHFMGISA